MPFSCPPKSRQEFKDLSNAIEKERGYDKEKADAAASIAWFRHNEGVEPGQETIPTHEEANKLLGGKAAEAQAQEPNWTAPGGERAGQIPREGSPFESTEEPKPRVSSNKEESVNQDVRAALGMGPVEKEQPLSREALLQHGLDTLKQDPKAGSNVVARLLSEPRETRSISLQDAAVMAAERKNLQLERDKQSDLAVDPSLSPQDRMQAQLLADKATSSILAMDDAAQSARSVWGGFGNFWQQGLKDDYTFDSLVRKKQLLAKRPLTADELKATKAQAKTHAQLEETIKSLNQELENEKVKTNAQSLINAALEAYLGVTPETGKSKVVGEVKGTFGAKVVQVIHDQADAARERIKQRRAAGMLFTDVTGIGQVGQLADYAIIGTQHIVDGLRVSGKWAAKMLEEFGEGIKPHLDKIWELSKAKADAINHHGLRDYTAERDAIVDVMKNRAEEGDSKEAMGRYAKSLMQNFVESGMRDVEEINRAVHEEMKKAFHDITEQEALHAWTGYGKFETPDISDPIEVTKRRIHSEGLKLATLKRVLDGLAGLRTGPQREGMSIKARQLEQQANEILRREGITAKDPESEQKTPLDAVKARLRNEIEEMDDAIANRERRIDSKSTLTYDEETKQLQEARDTKKKEYDETFPKEKISPEEQQKRAVKAAETHLTQWEKKLEDARTGTFPAKKERNINQSAEVKSIRAKVESIKEELKQLKEDAGVSDPRQRREMTVEQRLKSQLSYRLRRIEELQTSLAKREYGPKPPREPAVPTTPNEKAIADKLDAATKRKLQLEKDVATDSNLLAWLNRPLWERGLVHLAGIAQAAAISGYHTIGKLVSWDVFYLIAMAPREAAGYILEKLPILSKEELLKADMEAGAHAKSLGKFYSTFFTDGMKEAWQTLTNKGDSSLALEFKRNNDLGRPVFWYDYVGISHKAVKAALKKADFERVMVKQISRAESIGENWRDPQYMAMMRNNADIYSDRAILKNNNSIASWVSDLYKRLEKTNPQTGEQEITSAVTSAVIKIFLTKGITKVPLNYMARAMEYNPIYSLPRAAIQLGKGRMRGGLSHEEANLVYRLLVSGSIGLAASAYGIIQSTKDKKDRTLGGYYRAGAKPDPEDVPFNSVRIDGHELPHMAGHNPFMEQAQYALTLMDVANSKRRKSDEEPQGYPAALIYSAFAQASNAPLVSPILRIEEDAKYGDYNKAWRRAAADLVPMVLQNMAADMDTDTKRKPENFTQELEMRIPGLRQNVPEKPAGRTSSLLKRTRSQIPIR